MPAGTRLLDHQHAEIHWLVVMSGAVREDGVIYGPGTIRSSRPADRHFLVFETFSRCLILSGDLPQPAGIRRVLPATALTACLRESGCTDRTVVSLTTSEVADVVGEDVPSWLAEADAVCRANRVGPKDIARLAQLAGVSREHLAREYRRYFGTSVTDTIKSARLRAAWDAVVGTCDPLSEVAMVNGFADQSHMTRQFSQWIGLTPAALRRWSSEVTRLQDGSLALEF